MTGTFFTNFQLASLFNAAKREKFAHAAGNFLYTGASELVPEVNKHDDA